MTSRTGAGARTALTVLLAATLLPTASLWVSLLFLLQIEARNRLQGSPGESSPLYLALFGLPCVLLATAACFSALAAVRRAGTGRPVTGALVTCGALLLVIGLSVLLLPWYGGAMQEFATLPWKALRAS